MRHVTVSGELVGYKATLESFALDRSVSECIEKFGQKTPPCLTMKNGNFYEKRHEDICNITGLHRNVRAVYKITDIQHIKGTVSLAKELLLDPSDPNKGMITKYFEIGKFGDLQDSARADLNTLFIYDIYTVMQSLKTGKCYLRKTLFGGGSYRYAPLSLTLHSKILISQSGSKLTKDQEFLLASSHAIPELFKHKPNRDSIHWLREHGGYFDDEVIITANRVERVGQ